MKCKVCGFRLNEGIPKCPMCGAMRGSLQAGKIDPDSNLFRYFCPSCKTEIIGEHRYCPSCMKELSEAAKTVGIKALGGNSCIKCGVCLPASAKFCHECGAKQESHCTHCGAIIMPNAKFCNNCGAKQNSLLNARPTKDNGTNAFGGKKETPLEVFEYEVRDGKYILKGVKDTSLTDVVIPRVFSEIEGKVDKDGKWIGVFSACKKLKSVTVPNSVTKIGKHAFRDCHSLTNVTIPDSVTEIGRSAFSHCYSLTNVTIPNSVTEIREYAFCDCHSLTNVIIPNSVTKIGKYAFCDCHSLTNVTIPDSVTEIGDRAFSRCHSLMNVTIPNSVTEIGWCAFSSCKSLKSITIPKSVKIIGENIFSNCNSLKNVSFENPNMTKSDIKRVFGDSPSFTEVKIGNKVVKVSELRLR